MRRTEARAAECERGRLVLDLLADQLGHSLLPLALLLLAGLVMGFDTGFRATGALVLVAGSLVSATGMVVTGWPSLRRAYGLRADWMPRAAVAGIVPFIFGLYVVFIAGAWHAIRDFSVSGVGAALFFLLAGFWYLRGYSRLASLIDAIERTLAAVEGVPAGRAGLPGPALAAGMRGTGS